MSKLKESDVLLWDNAPPLGFIPRSWLNRLTLYMPPEESIRDAEWSKAHGWEWTYYPDGTKTARIGNKLIRFPDGI